MSEVNGYDEMRAECERLAADVKRANRRDLLHLNERDEARASGNEWKARALAAEARLAKVEALAEEWLTDYGDWQGRPRSWWEEQSYGKELRAALADPRKEEGPHHP